MDPQVLPVPTVAGRLAPSAAVAPDDVTKALNCGALVRTDGPVSCWSPMYSAAQREKSRLIFDLRALNSCMAHFPFKLETLADLPALAHNCRFAAKLDLQSAYWQYGVDEPLSLFLGTSLPAEPRRLMRWRCLPFGLSVAPFAFASLTHAFVNAWRACGLVVSAYLDDIIILGTSWSEHVEAVNIVVEDLVSAGLRISPTKAYVLPYTRLDFLGLTICLDSAAFAIPTAYTDRIVASARKLWETPEGIVTVRDVQVFLGRVAFASVAIPYHGLPISGRT
jgi:hypothetical protein